MKPLHRTLVKVGALLAVPAMLAACASPSSSSSSSPPSASAAEQVEKTTLTFSYSNAVQQLEKVPLHLALENLNKNGIATKESFHQSGDDAIQAVVRGESDFGTSNASSVFAATKKGVPIQAIMTAYFPAYLLVAPTSVADAGGLNGLRVGIQSKISSTTLYTDLALSKFPSAKPNILIVPGSANRVQAMIAGQLDASVVQFADWLTLQDKAPGKFHVIYDVPTENPDIIDSTIFASKKTLESNPNYVKKFLAAVQEEYGSVYSDANALATAIATIVPETSKEHATELADEVIKDRIWPPDGGFSNDKINATLNALKTAGLLDATSLPTIEQCCTARFIKQGVSASPSKG
jgi:NitT/TauT family transport system substrate-binding protein